MCGQTSNEGDDDVDVGGLMKNNDDDVTDDVTDDVIKRRSPVADVSQATAVLGKSTSHTDTDGIEGVDERRSGLSISIAVDGRPTGLETLVNLGVDGTSDSFANCETAESMRGRISSCKMSSSAVPDVSSSGEVGTATPNSDPTGSELHGLESSTSALSDDLTLDNVQPPRSSFTTAVSTPETTSSTPAKLESGTASASLMPSNTEDTSSIKGNQNQGRTEFLVTARSLSTTPPILGKQGLPRSVSTTHSTPGKDPARLTPSTPATSSTPDRPDPPRRRVMNAEFLSSSQSSPRPRKSPVFIRKMRNVNVVEGGTARFEVRVDGNPPPSVTWLKNGVELTADKCRRSVEVEEGRCSLVVSCCTEDDMAEYACTAVNDLGRITSTSQLFVKPTRSSNN